MLTLPPHLLALAALALNDSVCMHVHGIIIIHVPYNIYHYSTFLFLAGRSRATTFDTVAGITLRCTSLNFSAHDYTIIDTLLPDEEHWVVMLDLVLYHIHLVSLEVSVWIIIIDKT